MSLPALRKSLRTWAKDKPIAVSANADHINSNLSILERNPNDEHALAALRKNFKAMESAMQEATNGG